MIDPSVAWVVGDAEQLPIDDASMDAFTIAFGIRNCTHIDKVIKVPPPRPPAPTFIQ
jgi:2-methoxy-6-polyprenyl-1,4-benzoquinol methylase